MKTLKDLRMRVEMIKQREDIGGDLVSVKKLKDSAIEDIKELQRIIDEYIKKNAVCMLNPYISIDMFIKKSIIDYIKHKFNITEADLK